MDSFRNISEIVVCLYVSNGDLNKHTTHGISRASQASHDTLLLKG